MTTFSFHPVKPITTGEGGMIVTDNEGFYQKLMLFRSHGITRDENLMTRNDGPWFYQQLDLGFNYRITDIQCALGCSQMKNWIDFLNDVKKLFRDIIKHLRTVRILLHHTNCQIQRVDGIYISFKLKIMTEERCLNSCGRKELL